MQKVKEGRRHVRQTVPAQPPLNGASMATRTVPHVPGDLSLLQGGVSPNVRASDPKLAVGMSGQCTTKYSKGFNRRQHTDIRPEENRLHYEEFMTERHVRKAPLREDYLAHQTSRYGNVVLRSDGQFEMPVNRKHYEIQADEQRNRQRQMNSGARYYAVNDDKAETRNLARMNNITQQQRQKSSLIGVGRQDIKSVGVWDNFTEPAPVISRPEILNQIGSSRPFGYPESEVAPKPVGLLRQSSRPF